VKPVLRLSLLLLVLAGAAARLWQYLGNTSLWVDEIAIAENVIRTPIAALVSEPLALDQVAPPGFLAALKLATSALGPSEFALRLFPLVCGLASLPLFAILAVRTRPGWTSVFATALFAFSPILISYSAEAKPYSTDVCVSLALTLVALGLRNAPEASSRFLQAGLAGAVAVWFSMGAVLMVAGLGACLAVLALRDRRGRLPARLAAMLGAWAASAAAAVALGFHRLTPATREYMQQFWQPSLPRPIVVVLVLLASLILWRKRPEAAPLLIAPAAVALAAAVMHQYPFSGRAILFLTPAALLAAADGAGSIVDGLARLHVPQPVGGALFAVSLGVATVWNPPVYRNEETRPILATLASKRQPGDTIYVYYGAERTVRFYGLRVGIEASEVTFGGCHRGQPREYLRELDPFRGRSRVWVLFAHATPAEQRAIRGYLGRIGRRRGEFQTVGAAAELYDLSEPERLQAATAETYPVSEGNREVDTQYGCGHGPLGATPQSWK
jgi:hypothetical protein